MAPRCFHRSACRYVIFTAFATIMCSLFCSRSLMTPFCCSPSRFFLAICMLLCLHVAHGLHADMSQPRPDKKLLNNDFEGYKLGSKELECLQKPLITKVHDAKRDPNKFTYNYVRKQLMENHLFYNQWDDSVYFVDENFNVTSIREEKEGFSYANVVQLERDEELELNFSATLNFPTKGICLATTGSGCLQLITISKQWTALSTGPIHNFNTPISILNAYMDLSTNMLHVLVLSLKDLKDDSDKPASNALVHWLQISVCENDAVECAVKGWKTFKGKTIPHECWLSNNYKEFVVASDFPFELVNIVTYETIQPKGTQEKDDVKYYHWHQCKEMATIVFDVSVDENEVECTITHNHISIKIKSSQSTLLEGKLEKDVLKDASKWYIQNNRLEVVLMKKMSGEFWTSIIPNEKHGVHDIEGEELERIEQIHEQLEHLTADENTKVEEEKNHFNMQQLEDCDENIEEDIKIYSIDVATGNVATKKTFGGHQWLFSSIVRHNTVPHICLRHDVDGVIYQPDSSKCDQWTHLTTLDAFGYVLASKKEHKFVTSGPDYEYSVIADSSSNLYVYQTKSGKPKSRPQYVCSFPDSNDILGCVVAKKLIYILTDSHIHLLKLQDI